MGNEIVFVQIMNLVHLFQAVFKKATKKKKKKTDKKRKKKNKQKTKKEKARALVPTRRVIAKSEYYHST